ncbi:RBBP9/YdeN family alpha/beta hydrolase [Patescibacteria group bacterium]
MKRVFIIHGWDGHPEEGWFPWLKKELENKGLEVHVPQLPDPEIPKIESWVSKVKEVVGSIDEETYFVGHSMGCQTIARYLESLEEGQEIGGVIFVAGFFKRLTNLEDEEVKEIAKPWLTTPVNFEKIKSHIGKSVAIFSDDDPYVPLDNQDDFRDKLNSRIIIETGQKHFSGSTGTTELPIVLKELLNISK